jgi:hypothetical protein
MLKPSTLNKKLKLLSWNSTLGCWTFNLPAGHTCYGFSKWCYKRCYGKKGNWCFKTTIKSIDYKWRQTQDLDKFVDQLILELDVIQRNGFNIVRIHSSGDFYNIDYFRSWIDIAKIYTNITFYCYTKNWRLNGWYKILHEADKINNFYIICSYDYTMKDFPKWNKVAKISENKKEINCKKQIDKKHNCVSCKMCFNDKIKEIIFYPH